MIGIHRGYLTQVGIHSIDFCHCSITEVERVRQVISIVNVIHEPSYERILASLGMRNMQRVYQLVDSHLVEQTEVGVVITGHMSGTHIIVGEVSEQVALQFPLGKRLRLGRYGAEAGCYTSAQSKSLVAAVDHTGEYLEVDEQALFILDDLRLVGGDVYLSGISCALVIDKQSKLSRHTGLHHIRCEGVVTHHITLHEVSEIQFGAGLHGESHREEFACESSSRVGVGVAECTAEAVFHRLSRSGILGGDEGYLRHTSSLGSQ